MSRLPMTFINTLFVITHIFVDVCLASGVVKNGFPKLYSNIFETAYDSLILVVTGILFISFSM